MSRRLRCPLYYRPRWTHPRVVTEPPLLGPQIPVRVDEAGTAAVDHSTVQKVGAQPVGAQRGTAFLNRLIGVSRRHAGAAPGAQQAANAANRAPKQAPLGTHVCPIQDRFAGDERLWNVGGGGRLVRTVIGRGFAGSHPARRPEQVRQRRPARAAAPLDAAIMAFHEVRSVGLHR
jgi:hypothetical protein